jgi:archaellum biogenesis ATPase FlaH
MTPEELFKQKKEQTNGSFKDLQKKLFINADEKINNILEIAKNGFPIGYNVDIVEIANKIRLHNGNLIVLTGYSFHGKSHLAEQMLCSLMCNYKLKVGYYAAEAQTKITFMRSIEIILGGQIRNLDHKLIAETSKFLNDKMYVINTDNGLLTQQQLYDHIKVAFDQEKVNFFIIDNASTIADLATDDKQQIRNFLNELNIIKKTYNKSIMIVAHPIKPKGKAELIDGYSISGAAEWFNLADVGLTVFRDDNDSTLYVWKCKNYWEGSICKIQLNFNYESRRFYGAINNTTPMLKFAPAKYDIPKIPIDTSDFEDETPF